jgi:acetolactate decarboxylase
VVPFRAERTTTIDRPTVQAEMLGLIDAERPAGEGAAAIRVDGEFRRVRARSVPRQEPPYRPLAEVVAAQHVFELTGADAHGTLVGFRFPDHSDGIEVDGYHLHFISADRTRGGHVLDFELTAGEVAVDPATGLHVELPPGVDLGAAHLDEGSAESLRAIEHDG